MHEDVPTVLRILWVYFIILMNGMELMVFFSPYLPGNTNTVCHEPFRLISAREESMQDKAKEKLLPIWGFPRWKGAWMRSEKYRISVRVIFLEGKDIGTPTSRCLGPPLSLVPRGSRRKW